MSTSRPTPALKRRKVTTTRKPKKVATAKKRTPRKKATNQKPATTNQTPAQDPPTSAGIFVFNGPVNIKNSNFFNIASK
jgi:pSer/pThr/pTyr-binding forkhead associated (FHA) protein